MRVNYKNGAHSLIDYIDHIRFKVIGPDSVEIRMWKGPDMGMRSEYFPQGQTVSQEVSENISMIELSVSFDEAVRVRLQYPFLFKTENSEAEIYLEMIGRQTGHDQFEVIEKIAACRKKIAELAEFYRNKRHLEASE